MRAALKKGNWEIVISDHNMPNFNALDALSILQGSGQDLPFVILSGSIGEEAVVAAMKAGVHDFVMKSNMPRLIPVIERALRDARVRADYRKGLEMVARSQRQLAEAQRVAQLGSWKLDFNTGLSDWSEEQFRLFGVDPETFHPSYEAVLDRIIPADRKRVEESVKRTINEGREQDTQFRVRLDNGDERVIQGRAHVVRNPDGKVIGVAGTSRDITAWDAAQQERKKLEEQLRQAQKMEAVGQLAGGIAHDFNNFLSVIMGYSELVTSTIAGDPHMSAVVDDVREIKNAAERAATLTRQLLAFSRRQVLQPEILDLNASVDGMDKMVRRLIGEHIQFDVIHQKGLGPIKADPGQIEQVILNLVLNSRDAMPKGGRLIVETKNIDIVDPSATEPPPGVYVVLTVTDNGGGMSPDVRDRVSEPFFTTKEKGKGTGLGLSMVYGVVKQSSGYIYVHSEVGKGTTFSVYLPRVDELPIVSAEPVSVSPSAIRGGETILLAEDDEAIRTMVSRLLRKHQYKILVAANGDDALGIAERHGDDIQLIITDIVMPGISGIQLAEMLQAKRKELRVLFISGYTDNAIFQNEVPALSSKYLAKPFSPTHLLAKVKEILGGPLS